MIRTDESYDTIIVEQQQQQRKSRIRVIVPQRPHHVSCRRSSWIRSAYCRRHHWMVFVLITLLVHCFIYNIEIKIIHADESIPVVEDAVNLTVVDVDDAIWSIGTGRLDDVVNSSIHDDVMSKPQSTAVADNDDTDGFVATTTTTTTATTTNESDGDNNDSFLSNTDATTSSSSTMSTSSTMNTSITMSDDYLIQFQPNDDIDTDDDYTYDDNVILITNEQGTSSDHNHEYKDATLDRIPKHTSDIESVIDDPISNNDTAVNTTIMNDTANFLPSSSSSSSSNNETLVDTGIRNDTAAMVMDQKYLEDTIITTSDPYTTNSVIPVEEDISNLTVASREVESSALEFSTTQLTSQILPVHGAYDDTTGRSNVTTELDHRRETNVDRPSVNDMMHPKNNHANTNISSDLSLVGTFDVDVNDDGEIRIQNDTETATTTTTCAQNHKCHCYYSSVWGDRNITRRHSSTNISSILEQLFLSEVELKDPLSKQKNTTIVTDTQNASPRDTITNSNDINDIDNNSDRLDAQRETPLPSTQHLDLSDDMSMTRQDETSSIGDTVEPDDDLDNLFQNADLSDEFDVSTKDSSVQEVLMGSATRIVVHRCKIAGRFIWNRARIVQKYLIHQITIMTEKNEIFQKLLSRINDLEPVEWISSIKHRENAFVRWVQNDDGEFSPLRHFRNVDGEWFIVANLKRYDGQLFGISKQHIQSWFNWIRINAVHVYKVADEFLDTILSGSNEGGGDELEFKFLADKDFLTTSIAPDASIVQ